MRPFRPVWLLAVATAFASLTSAQTYQVIAVQNGGTIEGAVK
jgi:hypothetical protein